MICLGYATATGDLDGDGIDDIVAGVPRGNDLTGKIVLYTSHLKMMVNLTDTISPQQGEYCGSSLAVSDVNNDGRDDIIVGCPFFTDYATVKDAKTQERKPQYDVGKVIVFFQTAPVKFHIACERDKVEILGSLRQIDGRHWTRPVGTLRMVRCCHRGSQ